MARLMAMERRTSNYLRRWLGLLRSLSSAALYETSNKLQLLISRLSEEFAVMQTRELTLYRNSHDPKIASLRIEVHTGRKCRVSQELKFAEEYLRQKTFVSTVAIGKGGLGYYPSTQVNQTKGEKQKQLLQEEVRARVEEARISKMISLSQQEAWTRWESIKQKKMTWLELWRSDFNHIKFQVQAVYDTLPSQITLYRWGKVDNPLCQLYTGKG